VYEDTRTTPNESENQNDSSVFFQSILNVYFYRSRHETISIIPKALDNQRNSLRELGGYFKDDSYFGFYLTIFFFASA
jgi:hypothetical protein